MVYAVKAVDDVVVDKIFLTWDECKQCVWGKKAVYKSFPEYGDAERFLISADANVSERGEEFVPRDIQADRIYCRFVSERYCNLANGYCVYLYEMSGKQKVVCRGNYLPKNKKLEYVFCGRYVKDKTYGYQFEVTSYKEYIKENKESIINFLSCGIIKGIGPKKAEEIYNRFGNKSLEIFDKTPDKLLQIKGISRKTLDKMLCSYDANKGARETVEFLLNFGISQNYAMKLYKMYGARAVMEIKENPYILCDIRGLTFEDADRIAKHLGVPDDNISRMEACALYVLKENESTGNTGMEVNQFGNAFLKKLNSSTISPQRINDETIRMIKNGLLRCVRVDGIQAIFSTTAYRREEYIAEDIMRISWLPQKNAYTDAQIYDVIRCKEREKGITLDEIQRTAVLFAIKYNIVYITGGPGTGKTTLEVILDATYVELYPQNSIVYMAPTASAARVISETTGKVASTLHSFLHIFEEEYQTEEPVLLENALVVIDEFSMVDVYAAQALFSAITTGCTVVIIGDINQLPSVGPGAIMRDIIESGTIRGIELTHIYRQAENAMIAINAKKIKDGDTNIADGCDFHFIETRSMEDVKNAMAEQYVRYVKKYGISEVRCLCPYINNTAGVKDMNCTLQAILNPAMETKKEVHAMGQIYRQGDIVMHIKVNTPYASNGDVGVIDRIIFDEDDESEYTICVKMSGKEVQYKKDSIMNLTLAYATTVHKSQGTGAKGIVTCLTTAHRGMLYMNIPYVAISRGSAEVSMFGERAALEQAIKAGKGRRRITLLKRKLMEDAGEFVEIA